MNKLIKLFLGLVFIGCGCFCSAYVCDRTLGFIMAGFALLAFTCGVIYIWLVIPKTEHMTSSLMENKIVKKINRCGGYLIASLVFAIFALICPPIKFRILFTFMSVGCAVNFFAETYEEYKILGDIAFIFNSVFLGIGGYFLFDKYWFAGAPLVSKIFFIAFISVIELTSLILFLLSLINIYCKIKENLSMSCAEKHRQ